MRKLVENVFTLRVNDYELTSLMVKYNLPPHETLNSVFLPLHYPDDYPQMMAKCDLTLFKRATTAKPTPKRRNVPPLSGMLAVSD
jgi:uncharacterized protein Usg